MHPARSSGRFRLGLVIAALASLVVSGLAFISPAAAADGLLSQGKTATASSSEGAAYSAAAAVDGNLTGTRWASSFSDPQWLQVDLGATATISRAVLTWEAAYGKVFKLQISGDGSSWTDIYSTTTGTGGTQTLDVTGSGRYVRMSGTVRGTGYGYSLWEFQIYGQPGTGVPEQPGTWTEVWKDDFTGSAGTSPSAANWILRTGKQYPGGAANWGTGEVETMSAGAANVFLDGGGNLNIKAIKDGAGNWTSGRIETQRTDFAPQPARCSGSAPGSSRPT